MSVEQVKGVANAVLYEGIYPLSLPALVDQEPSALDVRRHFPKAFAGRQGDSCVMQTQVLLRSAARATFDVHVRFLLVIKRAVGKFADPAVAWLETCESKLTFVPRLEVAGRDYIAWDEAVEREIALKGLVVDDVARKPRRMPFSFPASCTLEPLRAADGAVVAALVRAGAAIRGVIDVAADRMEAELVRLSVRIENTTALSPPELVDRDQAQRRVLVATHTITHGGGFVPLLDPPQELLDAAAK